jgi:uncharacterized protein YkwD
VRNALAFLVVCLIIAILLFESPQWINLIPSFTPISSPTGLPIPSPSAEPFIISSVVPSITPDVSISSSPVVSPVPSPTPTSMPSQPPLSSATPAPSNSPAPTSSPSGPSHDDLVNYALALINFDRQSNGAANVTLSNVTSAQNHAENMLQNQYLSYWDTNGYKPHMRYTLAGGLGSVSENIASTYTSAGKINPFDVIKNLETLMMQSAQKTNILFPTHNKVSVGIAFDNNSLYFIEDFENAYVTWTKLSQTNGNVNMTGTLDQSTQPVQWIAVYYDSVNSLTPHQLANPPYYNSPCDLGTLIAAVFTKQRQ